MADVSQAGGGGDITEAALAIVLEQHVATAHGRDVEIDIAIVVDVGEAGRHADLAGDSDAGRCRDVLEPAAAGVPPELIASDLVDEVEIGASIAVDVGDRQAVAVIVVSGLVGLPGVVHDAVAERDTARGQPVGELEIMESSDAGHRLGLRIT